MTRTLCLILVLVCFSCGPKPWGYEEHLDAPDAPKWVHQPETENTRTHLAFVGVSARYTDEAAARADARLRAYEDAAERLGATVREDVTRVLGDEGVNDQLLSPVQTKDHVTRLMSQAELAAYVKEYRVERYQLHEGEYRRRFFVVYALLMVPRALADQATAQLLERAAVTPAQQEALARARRRLEGERP
ncbi:MAG: hypothetical protein AB1505_33330 [Candidatus Latescibacterota bacterium]